jgi:hypothetical protein
MREGVDNRKHRGRHGRRQAKGYDCDGGKRSISTDRAERRVKSARKKLQRHHVCRASLA